MLPHGILMDIFAALNKFLSVPHAAVGETLLPHGQLRPSK